MRLPAIVCTALLFGLFLTGCTASDAIVARQLTIVDGAAFVAENHARRQEVRRLLYAMENELIAKCVDRARAEDITGEPGDALDIANKCFAMLDSAYPSLATIELLREGAAEIDELRARIKRAQAAE
jgi:hypothetical protein